MTGIMPPTAYTHRLAALAVSGVLLAGPTFTTEAAAGPATDASSGSATAVAFRAALDVSRPGSVTPVPVRASLNEVQAPATAEKRTLDVTLDQVNGDRPVQLLQADAATARADAADGRAEATSHLVRARVHVPGLPVVSLVEVEEIKARAICVAGRKPVAESEVLGPVTALGKRVSPVSGAVSVEAQGVGTIRLSLFQKESTSSTAASTALQLQVSVDPLDLGVEKVVGTVTLAQAACRSPRGASDSPAPSVAEPVAPAPPGRSAPRPQTVTDAPDTDLAETGGSALTPYLLAAGAVLVTVGGGATAFALRRSRRHP